MKKKLIFISMLVWSLQLFSAPLKSAGKVQVKYNKGEIQVTTSKGFHLNKDAPADIVVNDQKMKLQPTKKTEKLFVFPVADVEGEAVVSVYVCDDANTVCEPQKLKISWGKNVTKETSQAVPVVSTSTGDGEKDLAQVLALANKSKKLVLLDFSARWCPPCIRLEQEVFNSKEFKALGRQYVVHIIDVDKESNYPVLEKYSVKAFPTLVVVNAQGEELKRYLDFQEKKPFIADLKNVFAKKPVALSQLITKAEAGDKKAAADLAERYYKSLQYDEAVKWYGKSMGMRYFESMVLAAEDNVVADQPFTKLQYQEALRTAIAAEPESLQSLQWRMDLAESFDVKYPSRKAVLEDLVKEAQKWIDDPTRIKKANAQGLLTELRDLEAAEASAKQGDAFKLLGNEEGYKASYEKSIELTKKLNPSEKTPMHVIYLVAYMKPVRPLSEIEPWIERLEKAYPEEFTYVQRHGKLLYDKKEFERALPIAQKAYDMSYGNNKFTAGLLLAQVKAELKQKKEAKELVTSLLQSEEAKSPRNKRIVKSIEEYSKKI